MENNEDKVLIDLKRVPLRSEREEIRNRHRKRFLVFLLCLFCLLAGISIGTMFAGRNRRQSSGNYAGAEEIERIMKGYWLYSDQYEDLSAELRNKALYGMTAYDFDPYTSYMSEEEMNSFSDSINRTYVGIGVQYSYVNDSALILRVFKSSPAENAGLKAGDIITEIDGTDVKGLDSEQIKELVLGEEGTVVKLKIDRGGEYMDVDVIRGKVDNTVYAYLEDDVIIMELESFGETTVEEVARYLDEYKDCHKIIIDLRNDTGGYQTAVRDISGLFIGPDEIYLRQKGIDGVEMIDRTPSGIRKYDNIDKIVVLTSENTASAAEVLTIVLKEKCNATIVGETTYGKGVIQTNRILTNGGVLKLTTYYWYSPNGVSIDKEGIHPDIEVKLPQICYEYYFDMEEDEKYEYDSVSEPVRISQLALEYLDYDIQRTDGYFDLSFSEALVSFKQDHDLGDQAVLDKETYLAIISETRREISGNPEKDTQLIRAKEIMNEN